MIRFLIPFAILLCIHIQLQANVIKSSKSQGCIPFNSTFSYAGGEQVISYLWEFGNGTSSSVATPSILFDSPGNFDVKLTIITTDNKTEVYDFPDFIQAEDKPSADFQVSNKAYCIGEAVTFANISTEATRFVWDFGDGSTSTEENPTHSYNDGGTYSVILIAYSQLECSAIAVKNEIIEVNKLENPDIQVSDPIRCVDVPTISFSTSHTYSVYHWDFGDGTYSEDPSPQHAYTGPGEYDVTLTVTDNNGCSATKKGEKMVSIHEIPIPELTFSETKACIGEEITFSGNFKKDENVTWTFSDGYSSKDKSFERSFAQPGFYDLTVQTVNAGNCTSTSTKMAVIEIIEVEEPTIQFGDHLGCTPFTVNLSNLTPGVTSYEWEINNTIISGQNPGYTFTEPGIYSVKAIMHHDSGCTNEVLYDSVFTVHNPSIDITPSAYTTCRTGAIQFELTELNVSDVSWNFGGYTSSNEQSPKITWNVPGDFSVTASFTNSYGCAQAVTLDKAITVYPDTIGFVLPNPILTCQSADVYFNGGLGYDFWNWDFGDGDTSTDQNPSHFYKEPGTYSVSLRTNNTFGCPTEINNYNQIVVSDIESAFTAVVTDTSGGCPNFKVQFQSSVLSATKYFWDFGNGMTSQSPDPIIGFSTNTQSQIALTAWNSEGCSSKTVKFVGSPWGSSCEMKTLPPMDGDGPSEPDEVPNYGGTIGLCTAPAEVNFSNPMANSIDWLWDFGDGSTSKEENPIHIYEKAGNYAVDLVTYYHDGSTNTLKNYMYVDINKPDANFSYEQKYVCTGTEVKFISPNGTLTSWEWSFGDGQKSFDESPTHIYDKPGIYQAYLVATDIKGCQSKVIKNISIGNPYFQFDYEHNLCKGEPLQISQGLEGFTSFNWNFGDGASSSSIYPTHTYTSPGVYQVSVEASADNGCSETFYLNGAVIVNHPKAVFSVLGDNIGCNQMDVQFSNASINADRFIWNFGNGQTSKIHAPKTSYTTGLYDVELTAIKNGCTDTLSVQNIIQVDSLNADFSFEQNGTCLPVHIQFKDESAGAISWLWDFGNGQTSSEKNPSFVFNEYSEEVILNITNKNGCKISKTISLNPFLSVDFQPNKPAVCELESVRFKNNSKNGVEWLWDFGDGNQSTAESPTHSYAKAGKYSVSLLARAADGCESRVEKSDVVVVKILKQHSRQKSQRSVAPRYWLISKTIQKTRRPTNGHLEMAPLPQQNHQFTFIPKQAYMM